CRVDVRAKLDEQLQHLVVRPSSEEPEAVRRGERRVDGSLPVLEARSATQQAIGVLFDELLDEIAIAERHRGKDVMPRPARQEQVHDGFVALSRRPTNHVAVVQVADSVNVSIRIEEHADTLEDASAGGKMKRSRVVAYVASVWIGAVLD